MECKACKRNKELFKEVSQINLMDMFGVARLEAIKCEMGHLKEFHCTCKEDDQ